LLPSNFIIASLSLLAGKIEEPKSCQVLKYIFLLKPTKATQQTSTSVLIHVHVRCSLARPGPLGDVGPFVGKFYEAGGLRFEEPMARHEQPAREIWRLLTFVSKMKYRSQEQVCDGFNFMDGCNHAQDQASQMKVLG
jgi:hypothetical protein